MNWESLNIIGMAGKKGSGKDTAADFLVENYGFVKLSFDWLIQSIKPVDLRNIEMSGACHYFGRSPRQILRPRCLHDVRKDVNIDLWELIMQQRIDELSNDGVAKVVFKDVSSISEALLISRHGVLFHLDREAEPDVDNHWSDNGLKVNAGEFLLKNNGTIAELHTDLECFMKEHGGSVAIQESNRCGHGSKQINPAWLRS